MPSNIKLNEYLFLSIPILLITGSFLPDLLIVIIFFYSMYILNKNKILIEYNLKVFIYFFLLFYFISLISSLNSIDKFLSLKSSFFYFRYIGLVLFAYYIYSVNNKFLEQLGKIIFYIYLFFLIDLIILFIFGTSLSNNNLLDGRFSSFFGSEKVLGGYIVRLSPLSFIYILSLKNQIFKKFFFIFNIILIFYLIILSGERTAFFIFCLEILIIFFIFKEFRIILFSIFSIIVISSFSILYLYPNFKIASPIERIIFHSMKQIYFDNLKFTLFSERHQDHYNTALKIFNSKPILGGGNKSFRILCALPEYTVKNNIIRRNTIYAQFDGKIELFKIDSESFKIFYKTHNKFHVQKSFQPKKFNELLEFEKYIKYQEKVFFIKDLKQVELEQIKNSLFKKNQKILVNSSDIEYENGCNTHPHNFYLQIAAENGLINLLLIVSLFFYTCYRLIKINYLDKGDVWRVRATFILVMIILQLIPFLPHGNFYNNWLSIFLFLPIGFYLAIENKKNE